MLPVFRLIAAFCVLILTSLAVMAEGAVTVFAAASLKGALDEVAQGYPGEVGISYGGSGMTARQVAAGAPANVVILANPGWMDWLEGQGALEPGSRHALLGNRLVLVGPVGADDLPEISADALLARLGGGRMAIGNTRGVPAGIYGRQWLDRAGLWPALAGHLAETGNVRAALALVSRGEVPLGLVYATDAKADAGVRVLYEVPANLHEPIIYPVAVPVQGAGPAAAAFLTYLLSDRVADIFRAYGFVRKGAM